MRHKVIIRRCDSYDDIARIEAIIREGMEAFGAQPRGRVLVKPNVVFAHRRYARHSFTNPAVLEGLFRTLQGTPAIDSVVLGERCGVTVPTRYMFREAGYPDVAKRHGVRCVYFDEEPKTRVYLRNGTVHRSLRFPRTVVDADTKIWVPKLKNHVSSRMTCTLKLNIGILDSEERLTHHDYLLEDKIADLFEVGKPDLVVVDAIEGGQKNELVAEPIFIGALVLGTNGVAVDAICARIMGLEPEDVRHLMAAHRRGYGPVSLDDIELDTDISLETLKERTKNLDRSFNDLRTMNLPVRLHLGHHPNGNDICHTGCINMLKAVFAILEANAPGTIPQLRPFDVVVGEVDGDVIAPDNAVVMVGDCTKVNGKVEGKTVKHVKGCPVPVPFFMMYTTHYGKVRSPYLDPRAMYSLPAYTAIAAVSRLGRMAGMWE